MLIGDNCFSRCSCLYYVLMLWVLSLRTLRTYAPMLSLCTVIFSKTEKHIFKYASRDLLISQNNNSAKCKNYALQFQLVYRNFVLLSNYLKNFPLNFCRGNIFTREMLLYHLTFYCLVPTERSHILKQNLQLPVAGLFKQTPGTKMILTFTDRF